VKVLRLLRNGASSVWDLYLVTLLALRFWKWLLEFCRIFWAPAFPRRYKLCILHKIQSSVVTTSRLMLCGEIISVLRSDLT